MTGKLPSSGYFRGGLPYVRAGKGHNPLVIFQGLMFENKPPSRMMNMMYRFLEQDYTVYAVGRKPGLPAGYTMRDMADDYAALIREEFGGRVDVIGVSTGGSIALHFTADHPDLVRRLVIHSSAHILSEAAKQLQLEMGRLAQQRRWWGVYATMVGFILPPSGSMKYILKPILWLVTALAALFPPKDPNDLVVTIEAEDKHTFKNRLAEISAPTLVAGGDRDPFYPVSLFRETADGIPDARFIVYEKMGHPAGGKKFSRDVLAFLREE
jgi:pimeloyl-ACP methyl ester carboxylesterase